VINPPEGWDTALDTGNDLIDSQHRALFGMIVELDQRMAREEFGPGVLSALDAMKAYAVSHFEAEENLMRQAQWPDLEEHLSMHAEFMQKTEMFSHDVLMESEWTALDVLRFLLKWLRAHISVQDKGFFAWQQEK
jgi:hemerythrin-like metal-binding protein